MGHGSFILGISLSICQYSLVKLVLNKIGIGLNTQNLFAVGKLVTIILWQTVNLAPYQYPCQVS